MANHTSTIETTDRELISSRIFNAPRELVFKAWTDPGHLQKWWGPKGFTNTFHAFDSRPGGEWNFIMHGPDGTDYKNKSVFVEIKKPERIVFDHVSGPLFRATVNFTETAPGKTKVVWSMLFNSPEEFERIKVFAVPGNLENLEKLDSHLVTMG